MTMTRETVSVGTPENGIVRLDHHRPDSHDPTRTLWLLTESVPWLVAQIAAILRDWSHPDVKADLSVDHFDLFVRGPDAYFVLFIHNHRDEAAPHGGLSGVALSEEMTSNALAALQGVL